MDKQALIIAFVLALVGTSVGFGLYALLFDLGNGRLRDGPRRRLLRIGRFFRKWGVLMLVVVVGIVVLAVVAAYVLAAVQEKGEQGYSGGVANTTSKEIHMPGMREIAAN